MRRVVIQNLEYVVAREQPGRDVELVECSTGIPRWVPAASVPVGVQTERFIVPDVVPLPYRDPQFLMHLRERRRQVLLDAQNRGRKRDPNAPKKPRGTPGKRTSQKVSEAVDSCVPDHLKALVKAALAKGRK